MEISDVVQRVTSVTIIILPWFFQMPATAASAQKSRYTMLELMQIIIRHVFDHVLVFRFNMVPHGLFNLIQIIAMGHEVTGEAYITAFYDPHFHREYLIISR